MQTFSRSNQTELIKKNIIFVCGLLPNHLTKEIEINSIGAIQSAADTQQKALAEGLFHFDKKLILINLMYIGSYPKRYRSAVIEYSKYMNENGIVIRNVGFLNVSVVKFVSRYLNARKELLKVVNNESVILIYAAHLPFIAAAISAKRRVSGLKICLAIPDVPEFMADKGFVRDFLIGIQTNLFKFLYKRMDGFLFVTKFIADYIEVGSKPYLVVDGLYQEGFLQVPETKDENFTILYSGTLAERYDIMNLIQAFAIIKDERFRLWIFGDGDCNLRISTAAKADSRITFFGQRPREQVLAYQKRASVLVNPRTGCQSYTKYSFPSKLLEYCASGTPVILRRLQGVDEEYYKHCFVVEGDSAVALAECLSSVSKLSSLELQSKGKLARSFVLENKHYLIQSQRVLGFLLGL